MLKQVQTEPCSRRNHQLSFLSCRGHFIGLHSLQKLWPSLVHALTAILVCKITVSREGFLPISIAIRTACPPLNHPLSDQPETRTAVPQQTHKSNIAKHAPIACTASWRVTGENSVAHDIVCTSSWHLRNVSLGFPV